MSKYIYIPVGDEDFAQSINDTRAKVVNGPRLYPYGKTGKNNYIISPCRQAKTLRDEITNAFSKGTGVLHSSFRSLAKTVTEEYTDIDLMSDETTNVYTVLIHFGGLNASQCRRFTRIMESGCTLFEKRFKFVAVSQANSYPPDYWKNGKLVFPNERDTTAVHSPDLNHLKSFYRQCQNILSEPNYIERFNDREFWFITLWDGIQPKSFDKAFSESEISLLLNDENKEMKMFFETLLFPSPPVPDVICGPAAVVQSELASATASVPASATISVPASATASASASATISVPVSATGSAQGAQPPLAVASASTATPAITFFHAGTVPETASIDAPAAYKIISQIMRIFNPPKPVYVPAYSTIKFSWFSKVITVSCFVLLSLILIVMPAVLRGLPEKAEYETESETRTPVLPVQRQKYAAGRQTPFFRHGNTQIDQMNITMESKLQRSENGQNNEDGLCRLEKKTKKAAPIQYFHMFLFFSIYALGGILCFVICLRFLRIHSREQKILNQEKCFSNLGRFIFNLKPEEQDAIVKQFAQASIRLYFNGDDGE